MNEIEQVPKWMRDWYEEGKKYSVKQERTKEELDALKEAILGMSFVIAYCKDKTLPEAVADQIMMEAAVKWYEKDFNVIVDNPYQYKELPAYHEHVKSFVTDFSSYINKARAAIRFAKDNPENEMINLELDPKDLDNTKE